MEDEEERATIGDVFHQKEYTFGLKNTALFTDNMAVIVKISSLHLYLTENSKEIKYTSNA